MKTDFNFNSCPAILFCADSLPLYHPETNLPQSNLLTECQNLASIDPYDLMLYHCQGQENQLQWLYQKNLYQETTIAWIAQQFLKLLETFTYNPQQRINQIQITEQKKFFRPLIYTNLQQEESYCRDFKKDEINQSLGQRFEKIAHQYLHKIAIESPNYQWTYQELETKINQVANCLIQQEIKSQTVALLFSHDAPMVSAILGVLKIGKLYVPLDTNQPLSRLQAILEDAQAEVLLTETNCVELAEKLSSSHCTVINVDYLKNQELNQNFNNRVSPDHLACLLYTSGSTGIAKGVIHSHRSILHYIYNLTHQLQLKPEDKIMLSASYGFMAGLHDIFGALLNGATLCLYNVRVAGLTPLKQWLEDHEITIYHSTPTTYRYFTEILARLSETPPFFPQLRLVVLGGEKVIKKDIEMYHQYFSHHCLFVNGLASTETSFTLQYIINQNSPTPEDYVPVGYPLEDKEILLINEAGVSGQIYGEIVIKTPYLASGYWRNPELTQSAFNRENKEKDHSQTIFRTGDLGRLRSNGMIEILGRKDLQVKIRGFRVELEEIETCLNQEPTIKQSLVKLYQDEFGETHLIGYLILAENQAYEPRRIRQFLQGQLPDYMIPYPFVVIESFPLTSTGKINRRALPIPNLKAITRDNCVSPQTEIENKLVKLWQDILHLNQIGITDNFFELGGHSLLAIAFLSQLEETEGICLSLPKFVTMPTITELATFIQSHTDVNQSLPSHFPSVNLTILKQGTHHPPLYFIHIAEDPFVQPILRGLSPQYSLASISSLGELIQRELKFPYQFQITVEELATEYVNQLIQVQPEEPYLLLGISFAGLVAYEMARQLRDKGYQKIHLILVDTQSPEEKQLHQLMLILGYAKKLLQLGPRYVMERLKRKFKKLRYILSKQSKTQSEYLRSLQSHEISYEIVKLHRRLRQPYYPQPYDGNATLFFADKELFLLRKGWKKLIQGKFQMIPIPGRHVTMFEDENVAVMIQELEKIMAQISRDTPWRVSTGKIGN